MTPRDHRIAWVLATWFGCGRIPWAPGTAGTLGAVPLYLLAASFGPAAVAVAALGITALGVWAASVAARDLGAKDPQVVVVDEVAGFLVTMLGAPRFSFAAIAVGFVIFRLLDSVKPWPVRRLEALPGGWGIVMDDVGAGILGAGLMRAFAAMAP